jgi:RimJ/RimL family protein N-acetyltransferase
MRTSSSRCTAARTCCATGTRRRGANARGQSGSSLPAASWRSRAPGRGWPWIVHPGAFIGWCSLNRWNPDYRSASLGYCFGDAAWGHGYATEAARALLRWAFDTLDLNRVQAETDTRNVASARVLEKLGFVREGTLREDCVVNGEVSDSWVYGLLRREWRPSPEPVPAR